MNIILKNIYNLFFDRFFLRFVAKTNKEFYHFLIVRKIFKSCNYDFWNLKEKLIGIGDDQKNIYLLAYDKLQEKLGGDIGYKSIFNSKPCFPHGIQGTFISNGAKIGNDCVIFQQVTIGSNTLSRSKNFGAPTIGDNCYIGAGAKIIGNIFIGNNCRIGANAVVTQDVPDNCVVVLQKARIIKKADLANSDNSFYPF